MKIDTPHVHSRATGRLVRGALLLTMVGVLLGGTACDRLDTFTLDPDGGPQDGGPQDGGPQDGGDAGLPPVSFVPVDILMVVDNSGSMADKQANLAANFARLADQLIGVVDYRLAIISTDRESPMGERTGLLESTFATTPPYQLLELSAEACASSTIALSCFRARDRARPLVDSARMDRSTQIAAFQANVAVGTCGAGREQAFDALLSALEQMGPRGCNTGFLRDDANLVILFVSDEDDDSELAVPHYVDALAAHKDYAKIRVGVIGGAIDGEPARCSADGSPTCGSVCATPPPTGSEQPCVAGPAAACPTGEYCARTNENTSDGTCKNDALRLWTEENCGWCSYYAAPDCCTALPGTRYVDFARQVELRVHAARPDLPVKQCRGLGTRVSCLVDSICQESYGDTLARVAQELIIPQ